MTAETDTVAGVVVIGRNEGQRLVRCLASVIDRAGPVVYVDSASSDGSVAHARSVGVEVVDLDMSKPFTMARARNAGLARLREIDPGITLVQFIDGDCELCDGWLERAIEQLAASPRVAVVYGNLLERHPDHSLYNRLAELEWRGVAGDVSVCGGITMMRVEALDEVGGFDGTLIAGEEPELCVRLRDAGWSIRRIDADMAVHDTAMTRFGQWWRRSVRSGHAFAELATKHGGAAGSRYLRSVLSAAWWGGVVPLLILGAVLLAVWLSPWWWVAVIGLVLGYDVLALRVVIHRRRLGDTLEEAALYAVFCVIAKPAMLIGVWRYWFGRARRRRSTLIEYKDAATSARDL